VNKRKEILEGKAVNIGRNVLLKEREWNRNLKVISGRN
jgi:hypothetical protein